MAYGTKPGNGALFKNTKKEKDTHPDYQGDAVLPDGTSVWLSAWLKTGERGKYLSVAMKVKEAKAAKKNDEEIPF